MTAQLRWPVTNQKTASRFRSNDLAIADRDPPSSIWLWSSILRLPNPPAEPRGMHKNAQKRITTHEKYRPNPNKWGDGRKYSSSTSPAASPHRMTPPNPDTAAPIPEANAPGIPSATPGALMASSTHTTTTIDPHATSRPGAVPLPWCG